MKLDDVVNTYVTFKRSLGMRYHTQGRVLRRFCRSMGEIDIAEVRPEAVHVFLNGHGPITAGWIVKYCALTPIDHLTIEDLSPSMVRHFLEHLEQKRNCSVVTRNQRLGTIHSLAKFVGMRSPEHLAWCTEVRAIPFKKTAKNVVDYLDRSEMDALLKVPDKKTKLGARNYALLLFLFLGNVLPKKS